MSRARRIRGRSTRGDSPEWQPLLDLAPEHIADFMWMFEVELDRGHRLHAYKHYWTRRYVHLDHEGRAFAYCGDELYQEVDPLEQLDLVLQKEREGPPTLDFVRQNIWTGGIEISWTRTAAKHRISRKRSGYVIRNCDLFLKEYAPEPGPALWEEPRFVFLGEDEDGVRLEVIALELEEATLLVIHAMRLRARYQARYEEIKRWRG
jgi:hypothetical protein